VSVPVLKNLSTSIVDAIIVYARYIPSEIQKNGIDNLFVSFRLAIITNWKVIIRKISVADAKISIQLVM